METGTVARDILRLRNELTNRVKTVERRECGGMSSKECRVRFAGRAVATGGARDPNEIATGIGDEEQRLWRRTERERDEILPGSERRTGGKRELSTAIFPVIVVTAASAMVVKRGV